MEFPKYEDKDAPIHISIDDREGRSKDEGYLEELEMRYKKVKQKKSALVQDLEKITELNKEELSTNLIISAEKKEVEAFLNSLDSRIKTLEV